MPDHPKCKASIERLSSRIREKNARAFHKTYLLDYDQLREEKI